MLVSPLPLSWWCPPCWWVYSRPGRAAAAESATYRVCDITPAPTETETYRVTCQRNGLACTDMTLMITWLDRWVSWVRDMGVDERVKHGREQSAIRCGPEVSLPLLELVMRSQLEDYPSPPPETLPTGHCDQYGWLDDPPKEVGDD